MTWINREGRAAARSLFLSAGWPKRGRNEIMVLGLHDAPKQAKTSGGPKIIETPPVRFPVCRDHLALKAN